MSLKMDHKELSEDEEDEDWSVKDGALKCYKWYRDDRSPIEEEDVKRSEVSSM